MDEQMRVLIVEDEMLLVMDIETMVEDCGHTVSAEAASVREVEDLPDDIDPHLALVDLHLAQGSSGLDASRIINRRWPGAVVVFVTANVSKIPGDFEGADGIIAKPFSQAGMKNALHYLADGVLDPPPRGDRPASLTTTAALERRWNAV